MSTIAPHAPTQQRAIEFRIFGPFALIRDNRPVKVPSGGPLELLTLLMLDSGRRTTSVLLGQALAMPRLRRSIITVSIGRLNSALEGTGLTVEVTPHDSMTQSRWDPSEQPLEIFMSGEHIEVDLDRVLRYVVAIARTQDMVRARNLASDALAIVRRTPLSGVAPDTFRNQHRNLGQLREQLAWLNARLRARIDGSDTREALEETLIQFEQPIPKNLYASAEHVRRTQHYDDLETIVGDFEAALSHNPFYPIRDILNLRPPKESTNDALLEFFRLRHDVEATRSFLPVSIYLGDGRNAILVENALTRLLAKEGLPLYRHKPPQFGSWFRRFWARTRKETGHLSAAHVTAELERKIRIEVFDKQQAAIDNQQATGAAALIAALQGEEHACIRVGSLLVLKVDGQVLVNNLTQYQLAWLERNQVLLRDPEGLLKGLDEIAAHEHQDMAEPPPTAAERQPLPIEAHE